jgi:MoxR-like ATPase
MHRRWLTVELLEGGSLLTPGASIWTNEHLAELTQHFVENPDAGGEDFLTKLRGQLREVSPEAVQLMAELHIIYFLIIRNGAVSAAKKLENIETILSWMPSPPRVSDDIREAMEVGLVHPGQWVLTRRDLQIAWTINFASLFRMRSDAAAIAADPWALRTFTEKLHDKRAEGARLGLLHLSHPDTFYATVSPKHRKQIYDRFSGLTEHTEDLDRALIDIQAALEEVYGEHLEFYADPLVHQWARDPQWRRFMTWTERVRDLLNFDADERDYKLSVASEVQQARTSVLDGDSDWLERLTSAFHSSRNNLTTWRSHDPVLTWMGKHPEEARSALFEFWTESDRQAKHWPRLLADRVDALIDRFPSDLIPTPGARLSIVGFLMMAEGAEQHPPITARLLNRGWDLTHWKAAPSDSSVGWRYVRWLTFLDEVLHDNARKGGALRDRLDVQSAVWMMVRMKEAPPSWKDELWAELQGFRGPVTVAAENESEQYEPGAEDDDDSSMPSEELRDRLQEVAEEVLLPRESVDELVALLEAKGQLILYGPPGTGKTFVALKLARALAGSEERSVVVQFHPSTSYEDFIEGLRPELTPSGQVTYALRSGPLVLMAEAARAQPDRTFVLVIDEINRANLPKVFGELLFLLEYREESARLMYRPEEPFRLPGNLLIIGTMNTADRSVALIDAAMRRRFNFVPFFPDQGPMAGILHRWLNAKGGQSNIATFLDAVNEELRELLGDHQSIGPSHFMQTSLTNVALRRIWEANVFPLLEEFFWGDAEVERWRWPAVSERYAGILDPSTPSTSVAPNDDPREVEGQDN